MSNPHPHENLPAKYMLNGLWDRPINPPNAGKFEGELYAHWHYVQQKHDDL